ERERVAAARLERAPPLGAPAEAERLPWAEREDVRPLRLELVVGDLDDLDPALGQELGQATRRHPPIHQRESAVERRDEAHEMHHLAAAVPVREVERQYMYTRKHA